MDLVQIDENINTRRRCYTPRNIPDSVIFRLPNEILQAIFLIGACDYYYDCKSSLSLPTQVVPNWVNVSYVCRHWRTVAINFPILWSFFFLASPHWTGELLMRSQRVPLKVLAHVDYSSPVHDLYSLERVMDHMDHIQELDLRFPWGSSFKFLFKLFSIPAPCLQSVEITNLTLSDPSPSLFAGHTPALRTLVLSDCSVPWQSFTLTGLTTLHCFRSFSSPALPIVEFFSILGQMPYLVNLNLHITSVDEHTSLSSDVSSTIPRINLSRLAHLSIYASLSIIIAFLSCVNVPLTARLRFSQYCFMATPTLDQYSRFSSLLASRLSKLNDTASEGPIIRSLAIRFDSLSVLLTFSISEQMSCDRPEPRSNCPLTISFHPNLVVDDLPGQDRVLTDFCCSLPLTHVQCLLVIYPSLSFDFWLDILGHFPNVRYLKLRKGRMPDIAPLLQLRDVRNPFSAPPTLGPVPPPASTESGWAAQDTSKALVPMLEDLELYKSQFLAYLDEEGTVIIPAVDPQPLYAALSDRRCTLTMIECDIETDDETDDDDE